jgi:peptidoglycan hydrolase-like protein with peptidoglycan-binding domain
LWYYVTYNSISGWLMGTYVNVTGSSSSGTTTTTGIGTVTITKSNTRIRTSPNGSKSGYVLSKGSKVTLLATPTTAGGYSWYYIKTSSGLTGYVRGDCCTVSYDASTGVTPSTTKTYVKLSAAVTLFTSDEQSTTGAVTVDAGKVLQMVSSETYTKNSVVYCSLYYNNTKYNCVYSDVSGDIMSSTALTTYITETLWPAGYVTTLKEDLDLVGDINVHSIQYALTVLGYYTARWTAIFGSGTTSAVRNFQRKYSLTVDGSVGPETSAVLYPKAIAALTARPAATSPTSGPSPTYRLRPGPSRQRREPLPQVGHRDGAGHRNADGVQGQALVGRVPRGLRAADHLRHQDHVRHHQLPLQQQPSFQRAAQADHRRRGQQQLHLYLARFQGFVDDQDLEQRRLGPPPGAAQLQRARLPREHLRLAARLRRHQQHLQLRRGQQLLRHDVHPLLRQLHARQRRTDAKHQPTCFQHGTTQRQMAYPVQVTQA